MGEQFVGTAIQPVAGTLDASRMSAGEPGLPRQFRWGQRTVTIVQVLRSWRETGPCHHGSGETYVRKHWYEVLTDSGETMKSTSSGSPGREVTSHGGGCSRSTGRTRRKAPGRTLLSPPSPLSTSCSDSAPGSKPASSKSPTQCRSPSGSSKAGRRACPGKARKGFFASRRTSWTAVTRYVQGCQDRRRLRGTVASCLLRCRTSANLSA